jgi:hypothetical protein
MLRRLALSFAGIAATAVAVAGCASGGTNQTISIGPSFAPQSLYASNSTQNAISIYPLGTASASGPSYQIGGSNTTLAGPQYLAFDSAGDLFVTNWLSSSKTGQILEIKALATGNVLPYNAYSFGKVQPRGISDYQATTAGSTTKGDYFAVAVVDPTQPLAFSSQLQLFSSALGIPFQTIAGPATGLNVPSGVAVDKNDNYYVTNLQGSSVEVFTVPTPSPTPSPTTTPSPSATPSPTPTPRGATPSPTPTPLPTATPVNIAPVATISGNASGVGQPTGIALDVSGKIFVSDQASKICSFTTGICPAGALTTPAILIFPANANGPVTPTYIAGSATKLYAPTDVKVDSAGKIYVADSTPSGAGVIYVFAAGATGNTAPAATLSSPGSVIGLALSP